MGNPAATLQAAQANAEAARAALLTPAYTVYHNAIASADLAWVNELASPRVSKSADDQCCRICSNCENIAEGVVYRFFVRSFVSSLFNLRMM